MASSDEEDKSNVCATDTTNVLKTKKKEVEPGVIYLSTVPPSFNVKKVREIFSQFGEIGRIFLQPNSKVSKRSANYFTEGWVEFKNKKKAKKVASTLNNTQVGGRKRDIFFDTIWNIKYLHRFRWTHLNERLAYEKAVRQQRMRVEIAQVKRETNHYVENVEKSKRFKRMEKKRKEEGKEWTEQEPIQVKQMREMSEEKSDNTAADISLLANVFSR